MVSLLNKSNAIYQLLGQPMFLLALLALCVLTVRVIHGLFHGDTKDLELWILTCGILLSAVLLRFGCGLFIQIHRCTAARQQKRGQCRGDAR